MAAFRSRTDGFMPVAFQFRVNISDFPKEADCSFQEVSGMDQTMEVEDLQEGGENRFVYKLPKGIRQEKLSLQRGIADKNSPLMQWCKAVLEGGLSVPIEPSTVRVRLLDETGTVTRTWTFHQAFPVRWGIEAFNSTKNSVAIETIELAYLNCTREL